MINEKDINLFSKLFDEKLRGIHIKIDAEFTVVNSELRQIKEQTIKTNSRVNHLEDDVKALQKDAYVHIAECPAIEKINKIDEELMEYKVFKKYPKLTIGVLAIACLLFLISTLTTINRVALNTSSVQANTEQSIKSDSLNNK